MTYIVRGVKYLRISICYVSTEFIAQILSIGIVSALAGFGLKADSF